MPLGINKHLRPSVSDTTGRLVCGCGKGYASEDKAGAHYGQCSMCYRAELSCAQLRKLGLKRP